MSLKEQKKYGGASMAGLSMRSQRKEDHLHTVANAEPKFTRMTQEAAIAFPALATEDPALYQLMESVDVLESRRAHLRDKLAAVDDKLSEWK